MASNLILTGGGIKSAVTAARAGTDAELVFLYIAYGQLSTTSDLKALEAAARNFPKARICRIDLPYVRKLSVSGIEELSGGAGKVGAQSSANPDAGALAPSALRGLMPVMISVACQTAVRIGAESVSLGLSRHCDAAHLGLPSNDGRSDAHREFIHSCDVMIEMLLRPRTRLRVECPLMDLTYAEIIKLGQRFRVPLGSTWTCTRSALHPCGKCPQCAARAQAFIEAGHLDPLNQPVSA